MIQIFKASLLSGLLPTIITPVFVTIYAVLIIGGLPSWADFTENVLNASLISLPIGIIFNLTLGIPCLLLLEKRNLNTPIIAALFGFAIATLLAIILISLINSWRVIIPPGGRMPFIFIFSVNGILCGYMTSIWSKPKHVGNS